MFLKKKFSLSFRKYRGFTVIPNGSNIIIDLYTKIDYFLKKLLKVIIMNNPFNIVKNTRAKKLRKKSNEEEPNLVFKGTYETKNKVFFPVLFSKLNYIVKISTHGHFSLKKERK